MMSDQKVLRKTMYKGIYNECVWHSTVSVHLISLLQSFVVMCLSKCCCHCWINCLKEQNKTWANFVNGELKIKNYTDANRILWHDKNAAWVFESAVLRMKKKVHWKRSSSPVWCQNDGKQHLCNGNLWFTSNHSAWRSQNVVQVCSKTTKRNTERKVLSSVSHFLSYVEINENFITFVETWAMAKSSKLSSSH